MKKRDYIEVTILFAVSIPLMLSGLVEAMTVLADGRELGNLETKSKQTFLKGNRYLRDYAPGWWDAANKFNTSERDLLFPEESVPEVTVVDSKSHVDDTMLGPGKIGTPPALAQNGESFDIYEMSLYFVFVGIDKLSPPSQLLWEVVTTEHVADHISNLCNYGFKNMDIKVTTKDQITNSSVIETAKKAMGNGASGDLSEDSIDSLLIMKSSIHVIMTNEVDLDRTSNDMILGSFDSDEKSNNYLNTLRKSADATFHNLKEISILRQLPTDILMSEPEGEAPTLEPDDSKKSSDQGSSGGSAFLGLLLGFSVCTLFFVGAFRGPLKQYIYHKRVSHSENSVFGKRDNFDVEIIKDSDVSTLDSRLSPYSADFHVNPETPSISQRFKHHFSKIASSSPIRTPKIFSPPKEVFTKLKAGGYNESFDDEDSFFELRAPPGMLGIIVESPENSGPTVHGIKEASPFYGKVSIGDKLIAVDGEDTTNMSAIRASKLISYKSNQKVRKLLFKRSDQSPAAP